MMPVSGWIRGTGILISDVWNGRTEFIAVTRRTVRSPKKRESLEGLLNYLGAHAEYRNYSDRRSLQAPDRSPPKPDGSSLAQPQSQPNGGPVCRDVQRPRKSLLQGTRKLKTTILYCPLLTGEFGKSGFFSFPELIFKLLPVRRKPVEFVLCSQFYHVGQLIRNFATVSLAGMLCTLALWG